MHDELYHVTFMLHVKVVGHKAVSSAGITQVEQHGHCGNVVCCQWLRLETSGTNRKQRLTATEYVTVK